MRGASDSLSTHSRTPSLCCSCSSYKSAVADSCNQTKADTLPVLQPNPFAQCCAISRVCDHPRPVPNLMSIAHQQMSPLDDDSPQHKDSADDSDDLNSGSPGGGGGQKDLPYALLDPSPNGGHNEVRRAMQAAGRVW